MPIPTDVTLADSFDVIEKHDVAPPGTNFTAYVESGVEQLSLGQQVHSVTFVTEKAGLGYVFDEFIIYNHVDASPITLGYIETAKSTTGFQLTTTAQPDTGNYFLRWKVRIPTTLVDGVVTATTTANGSVTEVSAVGTNGIHATVSNATTAPTVNISINDGGIPLAKLAEDVMVDDGTIPTLSNPVTLTNKTMDGNNNTFQNIPFSALANTSGVLIGELSDPGSDQGLMWDSSAGAFVFLGTPTQRGKAKSVHLAVRSSGDGIGTEDDPFDATGTKFDTIMAGYATAGTTNLDIHLIGTGFQTNVATTGLGSAFFVKNGWRIHGDGMYVTTVTMVGSMAGQHYDHQAFKAPSTSPASYVTISDLTIDANYATLSTTADTANSEKFYVAYGIGINGSYNTVERVRLINQYGTFANGGESFGIALGAATAGSVGATIRNCVVELPHGTYAGSPFAMGGVDTTHLMSDWSVHDNYAFGTNDGVATATFNTGGINIAFAERGEIYNNHFVDCRGIVYNDTGNIDHVRIRNNSAVRAWQGVGFVTDKGAHPTWTTTNIECAGNDVNIQDRLGGEFSAFRFTGGTGIRVTGTNIVTKASGGVGGGGAWTVLADNSVSTMTVNDLIGPDENASIVGASITKQRNRTPAGATITGLEDSGATSAFTSINVNPPSGDTVIYLEKNSVAKWQISSVGTILDEYRIYNYSTSASAMEIAYADSAARFFGTLRAAGFKASDGTPGATASTQGINFSNGLYTGGTLGSSAAIDTGTSGTKVPLLNTANTWSAAQTLSDVNVVLGTSTGTKIGTVGGAAGQKLGFLGATPIVQPLLATGAGATADNIITVLQNLGLVRQS